VSQRFSEGLEAFYGGRIREVLTHPRFRLHVVTSHGRHVLGREHRFGTPLGYLGAFVSNTLHRKAMGAWLERGGVLGPSTARRVPLPVRRPEASRRAGGPERSRTSARRCRPAARSRSGCGRARHPGRAARRVLGRGITTTTCT
jgi:hypothetical protein